jgi:hypothetical protein
MGSFGNQFLQQLGTGDTVRDYQHAARTFVDSNYRLGPKSGALFHVYMDVNSLVNPGRPSEIGLMAKTVALPKFSIQNKTLNAYNRKSIIQEKINYDPMTITFHDDSADVVLKFWKGYYEHYYRDGDHQEQLYRMAHKYQGRATESWGYSPKNVTNEAGTLPYINAIRIYSLHQKQYTGYTLINPTITGFQHGQHTQGEYNTLEHSMTVSYEAVKYETGAVGAGTVKGFGTHYDNTPSSLTGAGGTRSILGPGGLIDSISGVASNLESGNYIGAALGAFRTAKTFKGADLKSVATAEIKQTAMNVLRGQNPQSTLFVPTPGAIADGLSKAVNTVSSSVKNITRIGNMNSQNNVGQ